jgi:hypothetical protein
MSVESIVCFTSLEKLDISGLDPTEVSNPPWVAMHVCMLTNLQVCLHERDGRDEKDERDER